MPGYKKAPSSILPRFAGEDATARFSWHSYWGSTRVTRGSTERLRERI
jgi:hypothetical protein